MIGTETSDDAAVYRVAADKAMIQTVDFFTPIVDDPYLFGQIAAANSLSDIWAMGGEPAVALNIVGFPNCLDPAILGDIIQGGANKVKEAEAVLVGGHTIQDDEPKYGLCVTGFVHPDHIWRNFGLQPGDVLVLTKQLGSGIVNTAVKGQIASPSAMEEVSTVMSSLNMYAKRVIEKYDVSACTDVTGFGFLGHLAEMAVASQVTCEIKVNDIALLADALDYAKMGLVPAGAYKNRDYAACHVETGSTKECNLDVLWDPQTAGGLLFGVRPEKLDAVLMDLRDAHLDTQVSVVGRVSEKSDGKICLY